MIIIYVFVCVCVGVCIYVCDRLYSYLCVFICIYLNSHVYLYIRLFVYVCCKIKSDSKNYSYNDYISNNNMNSLFDSKKDNNN